MNSKILGLADPIVTVYASYANVNSIVRQYEAGNHWFLQKYFHQFYIYDEQTNVLAVEYVNIDQIKFAHKYHTRFYDIHCPALKVFSLPTYSILENKIDIIEVIKYFIGKGAYIQLYVNRNFLSNHIDGHVSHSAFIYGYDDERQIVYASDFFMSGAYKTTGTFPYKELRLAFENAQIDYLQDEGIYYEHDRHDEVCIITYNKHFNYHFQVEKFIDDIRFYLHYDEYKLNYTPIFKEMRSDNYTCGWDFEGYRLYSHYIHMALQENRILDYRPFCNLRDHKLALEFKIKYLWETGTLESKDILEETVGIVKDANILLNLVLKYNLCVRRQREDFSKGEIANYLLHLEKKESVLLNKLLSQLKKE